MSDKPVICSSAWTTLRVHGRADPTRRTTDGELASRAARRDPGMRIAMEQRKDLEMKYGVFRAPCLVLVDAQDQVAWRQDYPIIEAARSSWTNWRRRLRLNEGGIMLIDSYHLEVFTPPCDPGAERFAATAHLARIFPESPLTRTLLCVDNRSPVCHALTWKKGGHNIASMNTNCLPARGGS